MSIIFCAYCNSEVQNSSRFCSHCGNPVSALGETLSSERIVSDSTILSAGNVSTLIHQMQGKQILADHDMSIINGEEEYDYVLSSNQDNEERLEFERQPTQQLDSDTEILPILGGFAESPHGNVPIVHGTPQIGSVPFVEGTPQVSGSSLGQGVKAGNPASMQPRSLPPSAAMHGSHPQHFQHPSRFAQTHSVTHIAHSTHQVPQDHLHRDKHHRQRTTRTGKWSPNFLRIILAGVVVITGLTAAILLLSMHHARAQATLVLNGTVVPGGLLSVHGSNFSSGGTVTLTIDGQPATIASNPPTHQFAYDINPSASLSLLANQVATDPSSMVSVKNDGTFDVTIRLNSKWPVGSPHTLLATEQGSGQTATLTLVVPRQAALASCSESTDTITRTLGPIDEGQKQAVSATFALCTTGSGIVNWSASWTQKQAGWLQLPQTGRIQAPLTQQLQVGASAVGLKAGNYNTTVTFSSQNSSIKMFLKVDLIVRAKNATECLNLNTQSLSLIATQGSGDPTPKFVAITNCGKTGSWTVSRSTDDGANWLSVNPTGGNLKSAASQNISISALSSKLGTGTYTGQVTFKIGSGTTGIAVVDVMLVVVPSNKPCISAFPSLLSFTAIQGQRNPGLQPVTLGNCGSTGAWMTSSSTTDGANWLSISPSHGTLNANATQSVSVSVSSANLQTGTTYTGMITFSMGTSTATVNVNLTVMQPSTSPCITVDNPSISFNSTLGQGDPPTQSVTLTNCGPADSWSGQASTSWLSITPLVGNLSSGASQSVSIAVSSGNLGAYTYTGNIAFTTKSGAKAAVIVMWNIQPPPPCIQANTQSLTFMAFQGQGDPPTQSVILTNCGPTGRWSGTPSTTDGATWLSIGPDNSPLNAGVTQDVVVTVSSANLSIKTYTGQIVFTMGSSSATVNITLIVSPPPPPCIQVDQTSLSFAGVANVNDPPQQTVTITNCGPSGNWSSRITEDNGNGWLSVNPTGGALNSQAMQGITVIASNLSANLAAGMYTGHVTFAIGSSSVTVNVTLTVTHVDCIKVDQSSLSFSYVQSGTPSQNLTLTNCGSTGTWSASVAGTDNDISWLSIDQSTGTLNGGAAQPVVVTVNACDYDYGCLSPGTYSGSITFSVGSASQNVPVTFSIPKMQLSSNVLNFGCYGSQSVTITNTGGGTLVWTVSTQLPNWLTVTPGNGSNDAGVSSTLTFTVTGDPIATATIDITSTDGEGQAVTVNASCIP